VNIDRQWTMLKRTLAAGWDFLKNENASGLQHFLLAMFSGQAASFRVRWLSIAQRKPQLGGSLWALCYAGFGRCRRLTVRGSRSPPKNFASASSKTASSGAAAANNVIDDRNFKSSG
jgi:hypothetical protein